MKIVYYVHLVSVILFLLHYLVKTGMLLANSPALEKYTRATRIVEMVISLAFLGTGGYMLIELPEINTLMIIKLGMVFASIPMAIVGFKKKKKLLAAISLLLIIGAYGMAEMGKAKREKGKDTASSNGVEVYKAKCSVCHGDDGKAMLMNSPDLSLSPMDFNQARVIIMEGKGTMPAFMDQMTHEQVDAVAKYVQTLKK
ncbi:MAG: cytochrome c [Bacteroidia bacterium]|nr:cytochrome c [Bacteroidia bacterium]